MSSKPVGPLLLAVWLAFATWLGELVILHTALRSNFRLRHAYALLLGPLAYLVLFVAVGVVLWLIVRRWPIQRVMFFATTLLLFVATASIGLMFSGRLGELPTLLLTLGIAIQLARMLTAHPAGSQRLIRLTVLPMLVVSLAPPVVFQGIRALEVRQKLAGLPETPEGAPNVLLIILDTVRALNLSLFGYERLTTPELQRFAQRGVHFERAIATAPWTLPSHAGVFTGLFPWELKSRWNAPLSDAHPTLAEVLTAQGYHTAGFVGNLYYTSHRLKLDRGFIQYQDYPFDWDVFLLSISPGRAIARKYMQRLSGYSEVLPRKRAPRITNEFLEWLADIDRDRPFFAFLNYYDAHHPYDAPEPFASKFRHAGPVRHEAIRAARMEGEQFSANQLRGERDAYDAAIAYLDHELGRLFAELERRGDLQNTLVIVTSDHGEEFGEHGFFGHVRTIHMPLLRVPLVMLLPGRVPANRVVSEPVSLASIPATVLGLVGVHGQNAVPGTSLAQYWTQSAQRPMSAALLSETEGLPRANRSIVFDRWHYVQLGRAKREPIEQLYDYVADPFEQVNLVGRAEHASLLAQLRSLMREARNPSGQ